MEVKDIINEGRPIEPYSFETDNEVTWYKIGANDGYEFNEHTKVLNKVTINESKN